MSNCKAAHCHSDTASSCPRALWVSALDLTLCFSFLCFFFFERFFALTGRSNSSCHSKLNASDERNAKAAGVGESGLHGPERG